MYIHMDGLPPHKLAVIALKWAQFLVGALHPILSELKQPQPHLPPHGLATFHMCQFLQKIQGMIELSFDVTLSLQ